jgi:hypothetical protein
LHPFGAGIRNSSSGFTGDGTAPFSSAIAFAEDAAVVSLVPGMDSPATMRSTPDQIAKRLQDFVRRSSGFPRPVHRPAGSVRSLANRFAIGSLCAFGLAQGLLAQPASAPPGVSLQSSAPSSWASREPTELDTFMEKVLARREVNRRTLEDYILDEQEGFAILGPGRSPIYRTRHEYTWYVRDGMHVRSPVRFNGVSVGDRDRERYEADWIRREQERRERKAKDAKEGVTGTRDVTLGSDGIQVGGAVVPTEPRFVSEAYFLEFKFEPGNYYLAGREQLEGQDVLRIEYFPTRLFGDDDAEKPGRERRRDRRGERTEDDVEREIETKMNKTALVTLWVDPAEHQIVKYTFENVWLDFLPGAWLVRVDEIRASMTMGQPFAGVWLPREMDIHAGLTLANGSFQVAYDRAFSQYRLAEVETRIGVPKSSRPAPPRPDPPEPKGSIPPAGPEAAFQPDPCTVQSSRRVRGRPALRVSVGSRRSADLHVSSAPSRADSTTDEQLVLQHERRPSGPFTAEEAPPAQEIVGEVRVHGNVYLTDAEVLSIARVGVGDTLSDGAVEAITNRLEASRRFETVDVRKRYRSLTDDREVALVLVVHERPGVRPSEEVEPGALPGTIATPARRVLSTIMFLPIVSYADGYGFTYGGRASAVDAIGAGERLSVPLTWGGTRRAALEMERPFRSGPLTRISGAVEVRSRENPRFDLRDRRVEVRGGAERVFADLLRASVEATRATVSFGALDDRLWTLGTSLALDTRLDPAFPADAVYLAGGWTGLHFTSTHSLPGRINRYTADARGYLRILRQIVVAGRAQYTGADASLPPYERLLVGGSPTLRGFRAGAFDGDRALVSSAELRVPITSVLRGARFGVTAFVDAARVWDEGQPARTADWHRGVGAGVFFIASVVRLNLDVARGLQTGGTRVHLASGFAW